MKRQPRAKAMLPAIKEFITRRALQDKGKDRTLLAHELKEEIQARFPKEIPPTISTLLGRVSEARSLDETSPLDGPWSLAVLNRLHDLDIFDFDVDAEAIAHILNVQHYVDNEFREGWRRRLRRTMEKGHPDIDQSRIPELIERAQDEYPVLTIRQAKWVARLHRLQSDRHRLYYAALLYSNYEIVSEISGTPFNTDVLDQAILSWPDFTDLIGEYSSASQSDPTLGRATAMSFKLEQDKEGEEE